MALTNEDVLSILKLIDESNYDDVRIEIGDLKLHVQKHGSAVQLSSDFPSEAREPERVSAAASPPPAPAAEKTGADAKDAIPKGLTAVRAPMLGTFYRAPSPGEKPFVEVGDRVGPDDTVCLVEVMKLFNSVKAGIAGTVAEIIAENAAMVEHGQPLILIKPAKGPESK